MKRLIGFLLMLCLVCPLPAALAEPEIIVPDAYTQTGTMPVYRAIKRDFSNNLQPELFNRSGIASRDEWTIVFTDEAQLSWAPEALFYGEYSGTFDANAGTGNEPAYTALPALSNAIASLASWAISGWPETNTVYSLDRTELTDITLEEAQATLETLLAQLNVTGYTCDYALDMSLERIHALGNDMNGMIASGEFATNLPACDYDAATTADEGFYLRYHKYGSEQGSGNFFSVYAYVTERGVVEASIRDMYLQGDVYDMPEALVPPETVVAGLPADVAASRYPSKVVSIDSVSLSYAAMRAPDKADGMVLSPIWLVIYQDLESADGYSDCWAEYNAINGTLLNAIFK